MLQTTTLSSSNTAHQQMCEQHSSTDCSAHSQIYFSHLNLIDYNIQEVRQQHEYELQVNSIENIKQQLVNTGKALIQHLIGPEEFVRLSFIVHMGLLMGS